MKIKLLHDYGTAKIGSVFVLALYDKPSYYQDINSLTSEDFFWQVDRKKEENAFLMKTWLVEGTFEEIK